MKFRADLDGVDHRHPLLQVGGQHRHAHRQPVDGVRRRGSRRRPSPARRPPAGSPSPSPRPVNVTAGTTYVASYYAPSGHYSVDQQRPRPRPSTTRRCTRSATRPAPTASTPTARRAASRPTRYRRHQLLGRRPLRDPAAGPGHGRRGRDGRPDVGEGDLDGARDGGPVTLLPDHAVRRLDRPDATTISGTPPATRRRSPASPPAPRTRSRSRR